MPAVAQGAPGSSTFAREFRLLDTWAVAGRRVRRLVGLGACSWDETTANLGYRLLPGSWGAGLATEGSAALLRHAFEDIGMDFVWASTTQRNLASQRVLTKLSMRYLGIDYDQCQYKITAAEWGASD